MTQAHKSGARLLCGRCCKVFLAAVFVLLGLLSGPAPYARAANAQAATEAERCRAYAAKHPDMDGEDVRVAIRLKLDEGNYQNIVTVTDPGSLAVFVSKHYGLPKDYKPENLVEVDRAYARGGVRLRQECYDAFLSMVRAMEAESLSLYIHSGYRTNTKRGGANSLWYAWPGHSEHQTGLAFDLCKRNVTYATLGEHKYHKTKEFEWLCGNAHAYGFILSYPKGKSDITGFGFEPWHWRYVGTDIASDMQEKECGTFHEYWAAYLSESQGYAAAGSRTQVKSMAHGR